MEIKGLSVQGGYEYQFDSGFDWELNGAGIDIDLNADFDERGLFWSKFRLFYNASSGHIKQDHQKLADVDDWQVGFGLLAGVRVYNDDGNSISLGAGFGMGFGMMSVGENDHGKEKWKPDCPTFAEIVENFDGLTCYLNGLDGSYTSKKFLAEIGFDFGPLTLTPSFEWSFNARKQGQVMTDMYKVGVSAGISF